MPVLRGGDWCYDEGQLTFQDKEPSVRAENKPGHKALKDYKLPNWVWHPDQPCRRLIIEKEDYFGMAANGTRNYDSWNVAHVAAFHDDLKLLSLATPEQCREPNKYGMTPTHMCGMGQHPTGASLNVLYELVQMGAADPDSLNQVEQTPWHIAQRMQKAANLKKFERVLYKGHKPETYDDRKAYQLMKRGKFAREGEVDPLALPALAEGAAEQAALPSAPAVARTLPVCVAFPGQGSQYVGMLKALAELDSVQEMLYKSEKILGFDVLDLCLKGPEEKLAQTKYCQPAMYIGGLAALEQMKKNDPSKVKNCQAFAGLSLGEYTALTAAGVFDFETGLRLVKVRGEAMERETTKPGAPPQAMLSVAGLDQATVERLCKECTKNGGTCQIANFLFKKGFSVAGDQKSCEEMEKKAQEAGALQAKLLKTSGAFHTPLMAGAKETLLAALKAEEKNMKPPSTEVYMNVTGTSIKPGTPVSEIIKLLGEQLVSPVQWEQTMEQAIKDGCTEFWECGPSKQLKAMMKRIDPDMVKNMSNVLA